MKRKGIEKMAKTDTVSQDLIFFAGGGHILRLLKQIDRADTRIAREIYTQSLVDALGKYGNADRAYIFETIRDVDVFTNTYEWCAEGVTPQARNLQDVKAGDMPCWYHAFRHGDSIIISNADDIADTMPLEYELLKMQSIRSAVAIPLFHGSYLIGFLGLDNPSFQENDNFLFLLELVGTQLGSSGVSTIIEERLSQNTKELKHKNMILDVLCREYTSAYYVDLNAGMGEILKIDAAANAAHIMTKPQEKAIRYMPMLKRYADNYVLEEDRDYFLARLEPRSLKESLQREEHVTFRYRSIPNARKHENFEAHIIRVEEAETNEFGILLAFRYVDDIIQQEQEARRVLETALEESRISNSILSALGKLYFSLYRIDLTKNEYEEITADKELHRMTGRTGRASEKLTEICDQLVCPEHRDAVLKFFDLTTLGARLYEDTISLEYKAKDGNWHLTRFIVKQRNEKGDAVEVLHATHLINDTKLKEEKLTFLAERARQENDAKTEFLSRISHDIRTPMNAVQGFTKIALEHLDDRERVRRSLEEIETAGGYLLQLVNDVLDLNQIETGQMHFTMEEISVSELFRQFNETLQDVQPEKKLHLSCHLQNILYDRIIFDGLRLRQIYMDLLSNAIKFTPDGGSVDFTITQERSRKKGRVCLVSVIRDTGIGMTEEYMEEMYDRFSRAVDTRINAVRGSGLGLSVVKELTGLLGGEITAESEVGRGTVFTVYFDVPYVDAGKAESADLEENSQPLPKGIRLLIAEDNDLNYEVVRDLLEMQGIGCERAENGAVCVEKFRHAKQGTYDAVLMDMQMPVMGGIEAAHHIRQLGGEGATIPIIALTANAFHTDEEQCLAAGMNRHLAKPFDIRELRRVLAELLRSTPG